MVLPVEDGNDVRVIGMRPCCPRSPTQCKQLNVPTVNSVVIRIVTIAVYVRFVKVPGRLPSPLSIVVEAFDHNLCREPTYDLQLGVIDVSSSVTNRVAIHMVYVIRPLRRPKAPPSPERE